MTTKPTLQSIEAEAVAAEKETTTTLDPKSSVEPIIQ
jgi:hypothetical protein